MCLILHAKGMAIREINKLLSSDSGFSGMLERKCRFLDLVAADVDPRTAEVRDIFQYSVLKHIGAMINVLGGADIIVFETEESEKALAFMSGLFAQLQVFEPSFKAAPCVHGDRSWFSKANAKTRFIALNFNRWGVLADAAKLAQKEASP